MYCPAARSHGRTLPLLLLLLPAIARLPLRPSTALLSASSNLPTAGTDSPDRQRRSFSKKTFTNTVIKRPRGAIGTSKEIRQTLHPLAEQLEEIWEQSKTTATTEEPKKKRRSRKVSEAAVTEDTPTVDEPPEPTPKKRARKTKGKAEDAKPTTTTEETVKSIIRRDKTRVNIVNEKLVKDALKYIKPTLERHKGCDLVSVFPGTGLWSQALHDAVQPRSHLLLEPEAQFYQPFLQPLLDKPGVSLVPASGIVWTELNKVLTPEYFPNQTEIDRNSPPPRNDTLLVTMNLAMWPKRRFSLFDSISRLVMFQLVQSMRLSGLFQKYGQVRMLIWIPDDEKRQILPRGVTNRGRMAIEAELCTEYIAEVCGRDFSAAPSGKGWATTSQDWQTMHAAVSSNKKKPVGGLTINTKRWGQLDMESMRLTLQRMEDKGLVTPKGYETADIEAFRHLQLNPKKPVPLYEPIEVAGTMSSNELRELEEKLLQDPQDEDHPDVKRARQLRNYEDRLDGSLIKVLDFCQRYDKIIEAYEQADHPENKASRGPMRRKAKKIETDWLKEFECLPNYLRDEVLNARDAIHAMRQPEPILCWDRRPYEPLPLENTDFYPNIPCALLDIQPRAPHPLLRDTGPGTKNAGDYFDSLVSMAFNVRAPLPSRLDSMFPGLGDGILPKCKSLQDLTQGGLPMNLMEKAGINTRILNQTQMLEILDKLMKWPFRPTLEELLGRTGDVDEDDSEEVKDMMGNGAIDPFAG